MAIKKGYKQTEVGVIPQDWDVKLLPQVTRFRGGKAHEQFISETGDYVCVNSKFISSDGKVRKHCFRNFCCARLNDILMVMSDLPNGKALAKAFLADADDRYAVNQRVCSLTTHRDCPQYLFYILNRNPYFLKFDDGVSQTHLLNRVFQKCPIPLPPTLAEQEAIAGALSDADAWIESLEQLIAKKRQIKQGAMQELLTGKRRLPGFSGKWQEATLGEICTKIQDGTHFSPKLGGSDYLYLTSKNIRFGVLDLSTAERISANEHAKIYSRCDVRKGDLLLTKDGANTGNAAINTLEEPFSLLSSVALVRFDDRVFCTRFFLYQLLSKDGQQQIKELMSGNAITRLTLQKIRTIECDYPQIQEQTAIATVLSDMDTEIESLESKLAKAREIKQGMMQELLTGKIRLVKSSTVSANPQEMSHDR